MLTSVEIALKLEQLEAEEAPQSLLLSTLSSIKNEKLLWDVADHSMALLPIMRAIYTYANEHQFDLAKARAYLATGHFFAGDFETTGALVEPFVSQSCDPVLLDVWSQLPADSLGRLERMKVAVGKCADHRLYTNLLNLSLKENRHEEARIAVEWLVINARNSTEEKGLREIYKDLFAS